MTDTPAYSIGLPVLNGQHLEVFIRFNPSHKVFKAHFPGKPIVPGAMLVDILSATVRQHLQPGVNLKRSSIIKFLHVIQPGVVPEVLLSADFQFQCGQLAVQAEIKNDSLIFFKFKGIFQFSE